MEAFNQFDFESNDDWNHYKLNIMVPPDRDSDAHVQYIKMKWYKRNINTSFEIPSIPPQTNNSKSNDTKNNNLNKSQEVKTSQEGSNNLNKSQELKTPKEGSNNLNKSQEVKTPKEDIKNTLMDYLNFMKMICSVAMLDTAIFVITLINLIGMLWGTSAFYYLILVMDIISNTIHLSKKWKSGFSFKMDIFVSLMREINAQYILYCIIFFNGDPKPFSLLPIAILKSIFIMEYLVKVLKPYKNSTIKSLYNYLVQYEQNKHFALLFLSYLECVQLFVLLLLVFNGGIIQFLTYTQFIKHRYSTSNFTRIIFHSIGLKTEELISKYYPSMLVNYIKFRNAIFNFFIGSNGPRFNERGHPIVSDLD